jgi:hypothetical protein
LALHFNTAFRHRVSMLPLDGGSSRNGGANVTNR